MPMNLLNVSEKLRLEQEERATARLQHCRQRDQEGRQSEWTEVRQARPDRQRVQCEESVTFSRSIGVELNSKGSIESTCADH